MAPAPMSINHAEDEWHSSKHHSQSIAERLASVRLSDAIDVEREVESSPATPTGKQHHGQAAHETISVNLGARQISRKASSMSHFQRESLSMDFIAQGEAKFFALMEFMASASQDALSLKELWLKLMSERTSWFRERESLLLQIEEINISLKTYETDHSRHRHSTEASKKQIDKLKAELLVAGSTVTEQKTIIAERDAELLRVYAEAQDLRVSLARAQTEYKKIHAELEKIRVDIEAYISEASCLRNDLEKDRSEIRKLKQQRTDLETKCTELTSRLEISELEITTSTERIRALERERSAVIEEKDHVQEQLRKSMHRSEEISRELVQMTEQYERGKKETIRLRDQINVVEDERDELLLVNERLRIELKEKSSNLEDAESRLSSVEHKLAHSRRELVERDERIVEADAEISRLRLRLETRDAECSVAVAERIEISEELERERHELSQSREQAVKLQEVISLREKTLEEVRTEVIVQTERLHLVERERDQFREKYRVLSTTTAGLKLEIEKIQAEILVLIEHRDHHRKEAHDYKEKWEEITETITVLQDSSAELEFELETLRASLREARAQREQAVVARNAADRERDDAVARYEEKCREIEVWEDNRSSFMHNHAQVRRAESRASTTRIFSRGRSGVAHHVHHEEE